MELLANAKVIIILQYVSVSDQCIIHLNIMVYVNYISKKLGKSATVAI